MKKNHYQYRKKEFTFVHKFELCQRWYMWRIVHKLILFYLLWRFYFFFLLQPKEPSCLTIVLIIYYLKAYRFYLFFWLLWLPKFSHDYDNVSIHTGLVNSLANYGLVVMACMHMFVCLKSYLFFVSIVKSCEYIKHLSLIAYVQTEIEPFLFNTTNFRASLLKRLLKEKINYAHKNAS